MRKFLNGVGTALTNAKVWSLGLIGAAALAPSGAFAQDMIVDMDGKVTEFKGYLVTPMGSIVTIFLMFLVIGIGYAWLRKSKG